jgi:hypothetical protein
MEGKVTNVALPRIVADGTFLKGGAAVSLIFGRFQI